MLSLDELALLAPAESALFPSPIPVQAVSSDEFMPGPQTPRQREFEARVRSAAQWRAITVSAGARFSTAPPAWQAAWPRENAMIDLAQA